MVWQLYHFKTNFRAKAGIARAGWGARTAQQMAAKTGMRAGSQDLLRGRAITASKAREWPGRESFDLSRLEASKYRYGESIPQHSWKLWNLFPSLRVPVALEEGVKRLAIHLCLARGGADVAVATSQAGLGVRDLEACQVFPPRLFPRQAGKMAVGGGRLEIVGDVFRLENAAGVKRRQPFHEVLELPEIARPRMAEKRFIESGRGGEALTVAPGKALQEETRQVRNVQI